MIALEMITWKDLETERLRLREIVESDKSSIFQLYSDKASSLLDDWEPMKNIDEADIKIRDMKDAFIAKEEISFIITCVRIPVKVATHSGGKLPLSLLS